MKKSDLKDGMVLEYRNGKYRVLFGDKFFGAIKTMRCFDLKIESGNTLHAYAEDLICTIPYSKDEDIVRIYYMNQLIWERKEYVTFDEARRSGKRFKHRTLVKYYTMNEFLYAASNWDVNEFNECLDDKGWEIEK